MLANLLRPFLLVRISLAAVATIACAVGLAAAYRHVRAEAHPLGHPARIAAERSSELVSALLSAALVASVLSLVAFVVGAERAHTEIRGAMCAYGVLASAPHGFLSLASGLLASAACAAWLGLHRLDLALETPVLTRTKLLALFAVLPAVAYDALTALRFALELDFSVVATCCSSDLGEVATTSYGARATWPAFPIALISGTLAAFGALALARSPSRLRAALAIPTSLVFVASAMVAATDVVAPHTYGSPTHRCAFCLLSSAARGLGYPMALGLIVLVCCSAALLAVESERAIAGSATDAVERRLARTTGVALVVSLATLVLPVLGYRLSTGAFVVTPW